MATKTKTRRAGLVKIDREHGLYVLACSAGYTTLGFAYANRETRAVADWMQRPDLAPEARPGTRAAWREHERAMREGAAHAAATGERCGAELTPQLAGLEGRRVEVTESDGARRRFKVGKSTGWMPCHIELANARSTGGPAVMNAPFKSVRVLEVR